MQNGSRQIKSSYSAYTGAFGQEFNIIDESEVALVDNRTDNSSLFKQMNLQKIQIILTIVTIFLTAWFISIKLKEIKKS